MKSSNQLRQLSHSRTYLALAGLSAFVLLVYIVSALNSVTAANPTSGTLNPTLSATLTWAGTATGGTHPNNNVPGTDHDDFCEEGVNCDTYTLTVSGTPGDWAGKIIDIKIDWALPSTDYDVYVHKGSNAGAEVGSSGNNPPEHERVLLSPVDHGTGVYTVHVLYFAASAADQYQGSATVIAGDTGGGTPTPTPTPSSTPASCAPPGTEITTDPTGDASPLALNPNQLDITRVSIAEPASPPGDEKLSFSVDVADLSSIPASSVWSVRFVPPGMTAPTTYYYVSAESGLSGGAGDVTYHYGRIEGSSVATSDAAEGSIDTPNKRFIINVPRAVIGNPQPGQNLTDVHGVTQQQVGVLLINADSTRNASALKIYTLRGNAVCSAPTPTPSPGASPTPSVEPTPVPGAPTYANYHAPQGMGDNAGEPTLGANWSSHKVMYIAGLEVLRISFNDCFSPSQALWEPTNQVISNVNTADPILYTDNDTSTGFRTNRTFVSQLAAVDGSSLFEFTDDDGDTYQLGAKGSGVGSGVDHQTVGGGPYAKNPDGSYKGINAGPTTPYLNAVYYASQQIGYANLARSDNGGENFGPAIPMYDLTICDGLHGHVKVAPDGTIYVPNKGCGGQQAVVVSEDNGTTFSVRKIPGSVAGRTDPSVGIGAPDSGTGISPIYFGYANGDGRPRIAVSRDRGLTWTNDQNVGSVHNTRSSVFPAVVAGDGDRAAYFYLGSTTPGGTDTDAQGNAPNTANGYPGTWYGFISTTFDGGKTWLTTNATPKDPAQRGVICTNGTTCPAGTRNLLDFNDVTIDEKGRVLAAFADGCVTPDCINGKDKNNDGAVNRWDNDGTDKATIIRQSGGRTLLSAFDATGTRPPAPPLTSAFFDPDRDSVILQWETPDSEAPITNYKIYRTTAAVESLIATVAANVHTYEDTAGTPTDLYRVAAVSAAGESSALCGTIAPIVLVSPCTAPGRLVVVDNADDAPNTPASPEVDIQSIYMAEPRQSDNVGRMVFTMNVAPSTTGLAPPNSQWYILWNRQAPDADFDRLWVGMKSDAVGVVRFEYGKFGVPLPIPSVPNPNSNTAVKLGDADAGTYNPTSGVITITVSLSKLENLQVGNTLSAINARTFLNQVDSGPKSQRTAADITGEGSYLVAGTAACPTSTPTPAPGTVQFSTANYNIGEAGGSAAITVTRVNGSDGAVSVQYATSGGSATAGVDYTGTSGTLNFANGETSKTFSVPVTDDALDEPDETVNLTLSNPTGGATLGTPSAAVLTIADNEPTPSLSINDVSANEGNSGTTNFTFTVTLSAASSQSVTVNYATAPGAATAGSDYVTNSNTLTFSPGDTTKTVTVLVNGDTANESNEDFSVNLTNAQNASISDSAGVGTILNDDAPTVQFGAPSYTVGEGDVRVSLTVNRSGDSSGAATVSFATVDEAGLQKCDVNNGIASQKCDFEMTFGTLSWAAGDASPKSFSVAIIDDSYADGQEKFKVTLGNSSGAAIGSPSVDVTITDNDASTGPNPVDGSRFFIRLQYLDFLNREPEPDGMDFYLDILNGCRPSDAECIRYTRGAVSANFFRSPEFQQKGSFVLYLYMITLGQRPATVAELNDSSKIDRPHYLEFLSDVQNISHPNDDKAIESALKDALTIAWLQRPEVQQVLPSSLTNEQFVKKLESTAGVTLANESTLIANLNNGSQTRPQVLRAVAESSEINAKFFKQAFVTMEYFGYLRRDPEDCHNSQDPENCGFIFHNTRFSLLSDPHLVENFVVRGFIESPEYRQRFGP